MVTGGLFSAVVGPCTTIAGDGSVPVTAKLGAGLFEAQVLVYGLHRLIIEARELDQQLEP